MTALKYQYTRSIVEALKYNVNRFNKEIYGSNIVLCKQCWQS